MDNSLWKAIIDLLLQLHEGPYWDFKRSWYDFRDNKVKAKEDLLHDIICMANNLENHDAYIIIGVDEERDHQLCDVKMDVNRRDTQKLIDFLKDKKFAGDIRPTVKVESLDIENGCIDVIVIKNDQNTPYYLTENFNGVIANHIYTRIQDTNTPKDKSADLDKVDYLWRKRFGLLGTPLEKLRMFLGQPNEWVDNPYDEEVKYFRLHPEYSLTYNKKTFGRRKNPYYAYAFCNTTVFYRDIRLFYHQTLMDNVLGHYLDETRYFTPSPQTEFVFSENPRKTFSFGYMDKNSFTYALHDFFNKYQEYNNVDVPYYKRMLYKNILLFDDASQRSQFIDFVEKNWCHREVYEKRISLRTDHLPASEGFKHIKTD
ncbi:MAG: ATP-binding protein, partial [Eubacteriales bacterium]|nr:ATP-binding protein [Eubacteriales bacterium]